MDSPQQQKASLFDFFFPSILLKLFLFFIFFISSLSLPKETERNGSSQVGGTGSKKAERVCVCVCVLESEISTYAR